MNSSGLSYSGFPLQGEQASLPLYLRRSNSSCYLAAFLTFAQRFRCAAAIFFRAAEGAADIPPRVPVLIQANIVRACVRLAISVSISEMIELMLIRYPPQGFYDWRYSAAQRGYVLNITSSLYFTSAVLHNLPVFVSKARY